MMLMEKKMTQYTILEVSPRELYPSEHQPPSRMQTDGALNALKKSIQDVGLQYPPLVTRKPDGSGFTIVDGHRRLAAINTLSWPKVSVLVAQGNPDQLFSAVCGTTKKVTATQWVEVYLSGGEVPSGPTKVCINRLDETKGKEFLKRLVSSGLSPQIWSLANRVINYTKLPDEEKGDVLEWLLANKITRAVASWMSGVSPPHELISAFRENREPSAMRLVA
jgi:hypothetical protein